ncbi:hypothetical protein [Mesorhizobium sp. M00.F.Ca.ET.216.01.1.1]|uniref:DUF6968 family protein n=1 Tax=Mesorhizobium sp. M00.F.Ca.ET.216.01.1.1 TaxID=2500528 RepID=UPI000FD75A57|nr:hypothetical protein [Mesorhizobium sp. M00.F.Ca.ET.216.01.1.1]TGQ38668.1 hypothetical protein EN859_017570 [Mesorhizobium sp. M00.F.Ca.ET.216.01.1.1]
MDQPFVSRTFVVGEQEVVCQFQRPVPRDHDYRCDCQIAFPSRKRAFHGFGIDEVQALLHAMQNAHADILVSDEYQNQGLMWLDMRELGLPLAGGLSTEDFLKSLRNSR